MGKKGKKKKRKKKRNKKITDKIELNKMSKERIIMNSL